MAHREESCINATQNLQLFLCHAVLSIHKKSIVHIFLKCLYNEHRIYST